MICLVFVTVCINKILFVLFKKNCKVFNVLLTTNLNMLHRSSVGRSSSGSKLTSSLPATSSSAISK